MKINSKCLLSIIAINGLLLSASPSQAGDGVLFNFSGSSGSNKTANIKEKLSPALNSLLIQAINADLRISIAHDRNNAKKSCIKNPLSLVNGDELPEQKANKR